MGLPESFSEQMKRELGTEWEALEASYEDKPWRGYRLNRMKLMKAADQTGDPEANIHLFSSLLSDRTGSKPVAWCPNGWCLLGDPDGKHPLHYAGAYYIQEPSAMLPAAFLEARPGDRVLDLCAAPGGKSTQMADDMKDGGLLVSNDISASRGRAIVKNLERFGMGRILVTAEEPEKLSGVFPEYFDKILVDAPCSGEGMFRREPSMREEWMRKGPDFYAPIQREILSQAVKMLRPGGRLVYSTCTFSRQEDEENAAWLTQAFPEMELLKEQKLMPHRDKGEGQYAALFEKAGVSHSTRDGSEDLSPASFGNFKEKGNEAVMDFFRLTGKAWLTQNWYLKEDQLYELPVDIRPMKRLRFLRTGLYLGEVKKGRFEPSQALAMYLTVDQFANAVDFALEDERVIRYLKGETVEADGVCRRGGDGWCLVLAGGLPLGWAKRKGDTLKNKLEPGWRMQ